MRLKNRGAGAIGAVVAISAVMVTAGFGSLYLSQLSRAQWLDSSRASTADDFNKQALTMTNRLIADGEVALTPTGILTMAHPAATTSMWTPVFNTGATPELVKLQYHFCDPRMAAPSADGSVPDEASCNKVDSELSFQGLMPDGRPKVTASTTLEMGKKKISRSLTALVGAPSTLSAPPPPPPPPPVIPTTCTPTIKYATVNFEEFAEGAYLDAAMAAVLLRDYGIKFTYLSNPSGRMRIAGIMTPGAPDPSFDAWLSALCPGKPNHNRLCNGDTHDTRRRALSFNDSMSTKNISFQIDYTEPVADFAFDMLDLDGGENWVVKAYDGATPPNLLVTKSISSASYGDGSGNNAVTPFELPIRATKDIKRVVLVGTKPIKIFGTGFDNFRTGLTVCP